jgi:hypothetical protein
MAALGEETHRNRRVVIWGQRLPIASSLSGHGSKQAITKFDSAMPVSVQVDVQIIHPPTTTYYM